ncbi:hypothetical protein ZWY2020_005627 [Hordeum vulgare]|nr:hypothetical protein ZWY2020_005627 [Hordeum vulgare]
MASISDIETTNPGSLWELDQDLDVPMDEEASRLKNMYIEKKFSSVLLLRLAFQSLGVVFGDLGTSPLYVFYNIFPHGVDNDEDVIGALSLIIYTLTLIPLMKYVFVVLRANDNGQGNNFVSIYRWHACFYSLLCRHAKVSTIPNQHKTDEELTTYNVVVIVAVAILIGLFSMQHYGTDKVGWLFAPLVFLWFILLGASDCFHASGVPLPSPCDTGQAAYIIVHKDHVVDAFYRSIPDAIYWPAFIIATLAAIVASQATISATFSIIKQALALGCFPRVSVVHTSKKFLGQIYIPDINWVLMILCIAVTAGFKNQIQIGNAYGTAVVIVMLVTTFLMVPIMLLVWKSHWILVVTFLVLSLMVEFPYFIACINKVDEGGWVPLAVAITFFIIMYVWHFCTVKRYEFEMHSKVSMAWILGLGPSLGLVRVPGIGFVYTELASGVPHIFSHFITNLPAIHSVVVFVCVKYLPVYTVPVEERFIMKRIGPKNFHMFRCVTRYGYKDIHKKHDDFEKMLLDRLLIFVRLESMMDGYSDSEDFTMSEQKVQRSTNALLMSEKAGSDLSYSSHDSSIVLAKSPTGNNSLTRYSSQTFGDLTEFLNSCKDAGVVHILGNTIVRARRDSGIIKRIVVDHLYAFLRKVCREHSVIFNVPHESLLNVGQIYYI